MNHRDAFYNRNKNVSECSTCRSRYMSMDEVAQERRNSGWNPYWAEEEPVMPDSVMPDDSLKEPENMWIPEEISQQGIWGMLMGDDPAFESQRLAERDLRQLQSMYPEAAKIMLPYIEEICDKMEYEGSSMYDQYPDRITVYRLAGEIFEKIQDQFPEQKPVMKDEMLAMQYRPSEPGQPPRPLPPGTGSQPPRPLPPGAGPQPPRPFPPGPDSQPPRPDPRYGYNQPGVNWVQDLAQVLLLNEMHHRRRRKKNLFN